MSSIDIYSITLADHRHQAAVAAFATAERRGEDYEACAAAAAAADEAACEEWINAYEAACDGSSEVY